MLCVRSLPIFITQILYKYHLWLLSLGSTMIPHVHIFPPFHWTATVDPAEAIEGI